jgi:hypothetical protein
MESYFSISLDKSKGISTAYESMKIGRLSQCCISRTQITGDVLHNSIQGIPNKDNAHGDKVEWPGGQRFKHC